MSEENTQAVEGSNGADNVEGLKNKNSELLGKLKAEKEANANLNDKINALSSTMETLGQLVGVGEGENIADKAKALLQEKEQKAFDAMSETEKLNHRLTSLEDALTESNRAKEQAKQEAMSLRIDETLKTALNSQGVTEADKLGIALDVLKTRTQITGLNDGNLVIGDEAKSVESVVSGFLESNKFLVSNPSKQGSGFKGGVPQNTQQINIDQAVKNGNHVQAIAGMLEQQGL